MDEHHNAPTGEETGSSGPPPPTQTPAFMARRVTMSLRHDLLELESIVSSLTNKLARTRTELSSIEAALEHAPTSVLSDLIDLRTDGDHGALDF